MTWKQRSWITWAKTFTGKLDEPSWIKRKRLILYIYSLLMVIYRGLGVKALPEEDGSFKKLQLSKYTGDAEEEDRRLVTMLRSVTRQPKNPGLRCQQRIHPILHSKKDLAIHYTTPIIVYTYIILIHIFILHIYVLFTKVYCCCSGLLLLLLASSFHSPSKS